MVNTRQLHSFVTEHERKLDAKIEAVASDVQQLACDRHSSDNGYVRSIGPRAYQAALWAKFVPRANGRTWPMRYEVTPRG